MRTRLGPVAVAAAMALLLRLTSAQTLCGTVTQSRNITGTLSNLLTCDPNTSFALPVTAAYTGFVAGFYMPCWAVSGPSGSMDIALWTATNPGAPPAGNAPAIQVAAATFQLLQTGGDTVEFTPPVPVTAGTTFYIVFTTPDDCSPPTCIVLPKVDSGIPEFAWARIVPGCGNALTTPTPWSQSIFSDNWKWSVYYAALPAASFTTSPATLCQTQNVTFTSTSTVPYGTICTRVWDFGDGTVLPAAGNVVTHAYSAPGTYLATLTVGNAAGQDSATQGVTVLTGGTVNFTASPTAGCSPLTVTFTGTSTGASPSTWSWNFGDGTLGAGQSASHTYTTGGSFSVTLTAGWTSGCQFVRTKSNDIAVEALTADFSATPPSGCEPHSVTFTDLSAGAPSPPATWSWDFGDGSTPAAGAGPHIHVYPTDGVYTATLTVTATGPAPGQTCQSVASRAITVWPAPMANFSGAPVVGCSPLAVSFSDLSTGSPTSWAWDFENDGIIDSTEQNPVHVYTGPGAAFTVRLRVTTAFGCTDEKIRSNHVALLGMPSAAFSSAPLSPWYPASSPPPPLVGFPPFTVGFTDLSTESPTTWEWDFDNDGVVDSTVQHPTHTFDDPGTWTVGLRVTNCQGAAFTVAADHIVVLDPTSNTRSADLLQYQWNEVRGSTAANTARFPVAPAAGAVDAAGWQADAGRAGFEGPEPGAGCLGRSSAGPVVSSGWPLTLAGSFTISWWQRMGANPPATQANRKFHVFAALHPQGSQMFRCYTDDSGGLVFEGGPGSTGLGNVLASATNVQQGPGTWQHVALVFDATSNVMRFWFDGVPDPNTVSQQNPAYVLRIGELHVGGPHPGPWGAGGYTDRPITFDYDLDDFRLWARARTAAEILLDMASEAPTTSPFGAGCAGTLPFGVPWIGAAAAPSVPGPDFAILLRNAEPARTCALALGAGAGTWMGTPLPLSLEPWFGAGCGLEVALDAWILLSTGGGSVDLPAPIPDLPSLRGAHAYLQWIIDGTSAGAVTPGLDVNIE